MSKSRPERLHFTRACPNVPSGDCGLRLGPTRKKAASLLPPRDRRRDCSALAGRTPACTEPNDRLTKSANGSLANGHTVCPECTPPSRLLTGLLMEDAETRRRKARKKLPDDFFLLSASAPLREISPYRTSAGRLPQIWDAPRRRRSDAEKGRRRKPDATERTVSHFRTGPSSPLSCGSCGSCGSWLLFCSGLIQAEISTTKHTKYTKIRPSSSWCRIGFHEWDSTTNFTKTTKKRGRRRKADPKDQVISHFKT